MPRLSVILLKTFTAATFQVVCARDCYNYVEEPRVRSCEHGCCGDDYKEYCCDATLQIVGIVLGAIVIISIIAGLAFFCYRQKTKRRQLGNAGPSQGLGLGMLGRFGMRRNPNQQSRIPQIPPRGQPRVQTVGGANMQHAHYNPHYIQSIQLAGPPPSGYLYPANTMYERPPIAPTAPMPPPYSMSMAPPPYEANKPVPPPPEYQSVVGHGYKRGDEIDRMPPPCS